LRSERGCRVAVPDEAVSVELVDAESVELVPVAPRPIVPLPVDVVVAVPGLALIEPVAFVLVPVPVVALGLVDIVPLFGLVDVPASVRPVAVEVDALPVLPGFVEPMPPCDVPVAEVPLEPVPPCDVPVAEVPLEPVPLEPVPLPPVPLCARATPPAMPRTHRAAVAKVDLAFMSVSC
jgi:hypothetical protein